MLLFRRVVVLLRIDALIARYWIIALGICCVLAEAIGWANLRTSLWAIAVEAVAMLCMGLGAMDLWLRTPLWDPVHWINRLGVPRVVSCLTRHISVLLLLCLPVAFVIKRTSEGAILFTEVVIRCYCITQIICIGCLFIESLWLSLLANAAMIIAAVLLLAKARMLMASAHIGTLTITACLVLISLMASTQSTKVRGVFAYTWQVIALTAIVWGVQFERAH